MGTLPFEPVFVDKIKATDIYHLLIQYHGLDGSGTGTPSKDGSTWNCSHHWPVPVNLDEIFTIRIGETEIIVP